MRAHERFELAIGVNFQSLGAGEDGVLLSMESGVLYRCNGTAVDILDILRERPTFEQLCGQLAMRFEIDESRADTDLSAFLEQMLEEGLITKAA